MCSLKEISAALCVTLPEMRFVLRHLDDTDATSKSAIIHCATQAPLILFWVVNFNRFQIRRTVETTDGVQLSVDYCKSHLQQQQQYQY